MPTRFPQRRPLVLQCLAALLAVCLYSTLLATAQEQKPRLLDLPPFDRITLHADLSGETIDTLLLDLPNRQVPSPLPTEGEIKLRRVVDPSTQYTLSWGSIAKVELYEQLLLAETRQLIDANESAEAFTYLSFLRKHYPNIKGLSALIEKYLKQDALHSFAEKRYDDSISILTALYDFNPQHTGLSSAVDKAIDLIIKARIAERDFAAAQSVLDSAAGAFPKLNLKSVPSWQKKFEVGANRRIQVAQRHLDKQEFHQARRVLRSAATILPTAPGIQEMFAIIDRLAPQVIVGVTQHGSATSGSTLADMTSLRVARLTDPMFIQLEDFGSEGGIYSSKWANMSTDDSGLEFDIQLKPNATEAGIQLDILAMQILHSANPAYANHQPTLSTLLESVAIKDSQRVQLLWRHPHVRPEALLPLSVRSLNNNSTPVGTYQPVSYDDDKNLLRYDPLEDARGGKKLPAILERVFASEEMALTALLRGDIDVLDRIAPWQIDRIRKSKQIVISDYRLPTVHVLLPNYSKPLLRRREFRRALCYGIDRQQIVNEIILGGKTQPGFRVLSGPIPAGSSITDPLGYGYKQEILPRTYEPRLAAVLATVARTSLNQHNAKLKSESAATDPTEPSAENTQAEEPETPPLVLAHPPDFVARTTCQSIKRQLDAVGIPIKLLQTSPHLPAADVDYDLRYTELAIWEPIADMQKLLGPQGIVGNCSPAMSLALDAVDQARNWQESRTRLRDLHDVAFYDLPVVPLWQTLNTFAYRKSLQGIENTPISLYQDVANWKISATGAER